MKTPKKHQDMIHRISDQQKPEQKDQKQASPTSGPSKSSGTVNKEEKILNFLNTMKTHQQLTIAVSDDKVLDETMAKNILAARTRLGKFSSLNQVSATSGMDPNKFKTLIESLSKRF